MGELSRNSADLSLGIAQFDFGVCAFAMASIAVIWSARSGLQLSSDFGRSLTLQTATVIARLRLGELGESGDIDQLLDR